MAACYDLCAGTGKNLSPTIPDDFPWPAGSEFIGYLIADEHELFFKEVSFTGVIWKQPDRLGVCIIGTHDLFGWLQNMKADPRAWTTIDGCAGNAETGWLEVYQSMYLSTPGNMPFIAWIAAQQHARVPVDILGHSLGASVARLAAADAFSPLVTLFASPMAMDGPLERWLIQKCRPGSVSILNTKDVVPLNPPGVDGTPLEVYRSLLPELTFNSDEFLNSGSVSDRHRIPTCYLPACAL